MKKQKIGLLALVGMIMISMISPFSTVSANESSGDLNFKKTGENSWEYIKKKEDGTFKIVEEIDPKTGDVESEIYKLNDNNEFKLYEEQTVSVNDNKDVVIETLSADGEKNEKVIEIEQPKNENTTKQNSSQGEKFSTYSYELTPWTFSNITTFTRGNLLGLTIGAVQKILDATVGLPGWGNALFDAAKWVVQQEADSLYVWKMTSYKNVVGTTILAGIQEVTRVYKTSNMDYMIDSGTIVDCASGFNCN